MTEEIKAMAQAYAEAIFNQPNGWGQHCHPVTGRRSDHIMLDMVRQFGNAATDEALDAALKERVHDHT